MFYPSENPNKVHPWHFANVRFQSLLNDKFTLLLFFLFDDYFLHKQGNVSCFLTQGFTDSTHKVSCKGLLSSLLCLLPARR